MMRRGALLALGLLALSSVRCGEGEDQPKLCTYCRCVCAAKTVTVESATCDATECTSHGILGGCSNSAGIYQGQVIPSFFRSAEPFEATCGQAQSLPTTP